MVKTDLSLMESRIGDAIFIIRDRQVMLDTDLAALYGVETKVLNQAVKRHGDRFPDDFMFQLSKQEFEHLRSQTVTSNFWGGRRYPPYAFTEQGVAMLSSVLNSKRAIQVNVAIIRTFVRLRQMLAGNEKLARKLREMERKYDYQLKVVLDAIRQLTAPPDKKRHRIGFGTKEEK